MIHLCHRAMTIPQERLRYETSFVLSAFTFAATATLIASHVAIAREGKTIFKDVLSKYDAAVVALGVYATRKIRIGSFVTY
jgi:hypothetical protein